MNLIQQIYQEVKGIYGYRRITIYLNYYCQEAVNHKCVLRLMRFIGLQAVIRRRKYRYKPSQPVHSAQNILNRNFKTDYQPMEVLLTDVTEFKYGKGSKAYLSVIYDYGAKKVIAYQLSKRNDNLLVKQTLQQISPQIQPNKTLIHSDRGFQYTAHFFRKFIVKNKIKHSMSRVGKCIDNGPMEAFWGTIKEEMYRLNTYASYDELELDIKHYIQFYNTHRVTLSMGLKIPA